MDYFYIYYEFIITHAIKCGPSSEMLNESVSQNPGPHSHLSWAAVGVIGSHVDLPAANGLSTQTRSRHQVRPGAQRGQGWGRHARPLFHGKDRPPTGRAGVPTTSPKAGARRAAGSQGHASDSALMASALRQSSDWVQT